MSSVQITYQRELLQPLFKISCYKVWVVCLVQFQINGLRNCYHIYRTVHVNDNLYLSFVLFRDKDFWSGLSQPNLGLFLWEDCTKMTFSRLKDESYNSNELCYRINKDTAEWESKKCDDKLFFACEKKISGIRSGTVMVYA